MNYKLITKKDIEEFYPNNYDKNTLKIYNLFTNDYTEEYFKLYSIYHYYLDEYLEEILALDQIDKTINDLDSNLNVNYFYKNISNIKTPSVYIRNNIFIERLTSEELKEYKELIEKNENELIKEFVKKTYKKLIRFDNTKANEDIVNYDTYGGYITYNNSLVIGILAKHSEELSNYLSDKELEYTNILNIPVAIFIYEDMGEDNIELVKDIYEKNSYMKEDILKKYPKYLPLGSIVELKESYQKIMIIGYSQVDLKDRKIYDYCACLYPDGVVGSDIYILFNHEDIKAIHAIGMIDNETKEFLDNIEKYIGNEEENRKKLENLK